MIKRRLNKTPTIKMQSPSTTDEFSSSSIKLTGVISDTKFVLYSGYSEFSSRALALKVFPKDGLKVNEFYICESRFTILNHPNVIQFYKAVDDMSLSKVENSVIFMELAQYDLVEFSNIFFIKNDEILIRTVFHQLIDGLDYLHRRFVAHLDLTPENLLIGNDGKVKIADFATSYLKGDEKINSKGTRNFRAPEVFEENIKNPFKADIYSAGMILFHLKYGNFNFSRRVSEESDFMNLLFNQPSEFVKDCMTYIDKCDLGTDSDFKNLFLGMTKKNPMDRFTIGKIKTTPWYNGPVYGEDEMSFFINNRKF